jgi:hypothetical protein
MFDLIIKQVNHHLVVPSILILALFSLSLTAFAFSVKR